MLSYTQFLKTSNFLSTICVFDRDENGYKRWKHPLSNKSVVKKDISKSVKHVHDFSYLFKNMTPEQREKLLKMVEENREKTRKEFAPLQGQPSFVKQKALGYKPDKKYIPTKPPKLRFRPGCFLRHKQNKELFCIRIAFRTFKEPHEWMFVLEERKSLDRPTTVMSQFCELQGSKGTEDCNIHYDPVNDFIDIKQVNMYMFGSWIIESNKKILHNYEIVTTV